MCFTLSWHPPEGVTSGLTIIFLLQQIALLHKGETLSFCGDFILTSEKGSKPTYLTDPCEMTTTRQHLVSGKCQRFSSWSRTGLEQRDISWLGTKRASPNNTSHRAYALQIAIFHLLDSLIHLKDLRLTLQLVCFLSSHQTHKALSEGLRTLILPARAQKA